ncbi:MAG: hypothetical protein WA691_02875 [Thermoplasmata archaeon]
MASFALGAFVIVLGALLMADETFQFSQVALVVVGFILLAVGIVIDYRWSSRRS